MLVTFLPLDQSSVSESHVPVCFLSGANAAMQQERAADFVAVLSSAVRVRGGGLGAEDQPGGSAGNEGGDAVILFLKILLRLPDSVLTIRSVL